MQVKQVTPSVAKWKRNGMDWMNHLARIAAVSRRADASDPKKNLKRVERCWKQGHVGIFEHWPVVQTGTPWTTEVPILPWRTRNCTYYGNLRHIVDAVGDTAEFPQESLQRAAEQSISGDPEEELHTFFVKCSRVCSHQLVRYRAYMSIVQESQRYVNYAKLGGEFILPTKATGFVKAAIVKAFRDYEWAVNGGVNPEDARYLLPGACVTRMVMTAPLWEWRHVFTQRALHNTGIAQEETTDVARQIQKLLEVEDV